MNSGEMSSNCRLFFISLQSFLTKIFKAVFPQLLCNTSNHRSVEYVENAPNKYCCHRPSARKYETGASLSQNRVKTNARLCSIFVFGKRGGRLRVHAQPRELTYLATQRAKRASRDNASFCKVTQKRRRICGLLSFHILLRTRAAVRQPKLKASEPMVQPFFPSLEVMAWSKDVLRKISHSAPLPASEAG